MWVRHKHNTFRASLIGSLNLFFLEQINKKINSNSPFKMLKKERNCYSCSLGKESTIHAPYELNSIKYKTIQFFYSSLSLSLSLSLKYPTLSFTLKCLSPNPIDRSHSHYKWNPTAQYPALLHH